MGYNPTKLQLEEIAAGEALKMKMWTPEKFLIAIEKYSINTGSSIIESVVEYCETKEIDLNIVGKDLISPRLYSLIQDEAEERGLITFTNKLNFV